MRTYLGRFKILHFGSGLGVLALIALNLIFLEGCTTVPVTGRRELNLVSSGEQMQLGLSSFDPLKKDTPVSHDSAMSAMIQRVGKRIAEVASKDMPGAQCHLVGFDSKGASAVG